MGRLAILTAALLWSTSGAFVKNLDLPATPVAMYRALSAGVVLLVLCGARRTRCALDSRMIPMAAAFTIMNLTFIASMTRTSAANAIFLQYTAPAWIYVVSVWRLREPSERRNLIAVMGALAGIAILVIGQWNAGAQHRMGIVFGLASGATFAGVALSLRWLREHDPLWLATLNHLSAGVSVLAGMLAGVALGAVEPAMLVPPTFDKFALLTLFGTAQMAIPYVIFAWGLRRVTSQEAGILALLEPILNPVWTYLTAGERPSTATLVGGCVLVAMLVVRYLPMPGHNAIPLSDSDRPDDSSSAWRQRRR